MTRPRILLFLLALAAAFPVLAARSRSVRPLPDALYTGTIVDAQSHKPVAEAEVSSGGKATRTDANGVFGLLLPAGRPAILSIHRTGYDPLQTTVQVPPATNGGGVIISPPVAAPPPPTASTIPITLKPRPAVTVKLTSLRTMQFDAETVRFAYVLPFANPGTSETASFCRADGTSWDPEQHEIAKIIGPAKPATSASCCNIGPILAVTALLKDGTSHDVYFADSCFGYEIDLLGRDRDTAQYVYVRFEEVLEIVFP